MSTLPPEHATRVLVVTAADSRFIGLLRGMLESLSPLLDTKEVDLACFDLGLNARDRSWLSSRGAVLRSPGVHFGISEEAHSPALRSFLARPFLPDYFPGYDVYIWIDSDVWLQDVSVIRHYVASALKDGLAVTHERERAYRLQPWLLGWTAKHFLLGYGPLLGGYLLAMPHLNAGFFAAAADAPHWAAWARNYERAFRRTAALVPHDQFALNHALHARGGARLKSAILDPGNNWICDRGTPAWNDERQAYCKPYPPYDPIGALHLAGPAKRKEYVIRRTGGGSFKTAILWGSSPDNPQAVPKYE